MPSEAGSVISGTIETYVTAPNGPNIAQISFSDTDNGRFVTEISQIMSIAIETVLTRYKNGKVLFRVSHRHILKIVMRDRFTKSTSLIIAVLRGPTNKLSRMFE